LMATGGLNLAPLTTHRFPIENARDAYDLIVGPEPPIGILLEYPHDEGSGLRAFERTVALKATTPGRPVQPCRSALRIGVVGAGSYATRALLPALEAVGVDIVSIASKTGV